MEERKRGMKEAWHPLFGRYMPPFFPLLLAHLGNNR